MISRPSSYTVTQDILNPELLHNTCTFIKRRAIFWYLYVEAYTARLRACAESSNLKLRQLQVPLGTSCGHWLYVTSNAGFHLNIDSDGLISKSIVCIVRNPMRRMLLVVDTRLTALLCWIIALLLFRIFENEMLPSDSSPLFLPELAALLLEFNLLKNFSLEEALIKSLR